MTFDVLLLKLCHSHCTDNNSTRYEEIIQHLHFKLELLRLFKEVVHDELAHKVWVQSILDSFGPSKLHGYHYNSQHKVQKMITLLLHIDFCILPRLLTYYPTSSRLKALSVNRAGHPANLGCILARVYLLQTQSATRRTSSRVQTPG